MVVGRNSRLLSQNKWRYSQSTKQQEHSIFQWFSLFQSPVRLMSVWRDTMSNEFATPPRQPESRTSPFYLSVLWEAAANIVANNTAGFFAFEGGFCACLSSLVSKLTAPQRSFQTQNHCLTRRDGSRGLAEGEFQCSCLLSFSILDPPSSFTLFFFFLVIFSCLPVYQYTLSVLYTAFYIIKLAQLNNLILLGPGLHQVSIILKSYFALKTPFFIPDIQELSLGIFVFYSRCAFFPVP